MDLHSPDTALLELLHKDDRQAFDTLYYTYVTAVHANILKIVKDEPLSMDILQDVFMMLWEKRHKVKADQPLAGWLFVVSYRMSLKKLKSEARKNHMLKSYGLEGSFTDEGELISETSLRENEQITALYRAVDALPEKKRKAFTLCRLEGKTYQEAADIMGISKETVKDYLSTTTAFLKEKITADAVATGSFGLLILAGAFSS